MDLVIDANILMSALISARGKNLDLIFNDGLKLYAPEFLLEEVRKHKQEIIEKSKLSAKELDLFLSIISTRIEFMPFDEFQKFMKEAKETSPDVNDSEYFALAFKKKCGIWTNDKKLKNQKLVKIISTKELLDLLK